MKEVLFNTHDLALIFTIFICLSFSVFLVTLKKGNKLSNYLLACFLLTQAAIPTDNLINFGEAFRAFALSLSPNLFYTFGLAFWLEVPLLLLYIKSLVNKNYQLKKRDSLLFIPFIFYAAYFTVDWLMIENSIKLALLLTSFTLKGTFCPCCSKNKNSTSLEMEFLYRLTLSQPTIP